MRKKLLILALSFGIGGAYAQDLTSKKGEPILPEADDWAISLDATPFLDYFGNMFNGTANNSPFSGNFTQHYPLYTITGKMFKDEKTAYRAMLRLGFGSTTYTNFVSDDANTTTTPTQVSDQLKMSGNNITIGGGMEFRRGKTRLQGYYGGMLYISLSGSKEDYSYGNSYSTSNVTPTSTDWSSITGNAPLAGGARYTYVKNGSTFGLGIRGFLGVEYFILPKMSLGVEYGWGLGMSNTGEGEVSIEGWNGTAVQGVTSKVGGMKSFGFDTDINNAFGGGAAITATFHF